MPHFELLQGDPYKPESAVNLETPHTVNVTCPHCSRAGAFTPIRDLPDLIYAKAVHVPGQLGSKTLAPFRAGWRSCPNLECKGLVAILFGVGPADSIKRVAPPEIIDFRTEHIPADIVSSMREAIVAHSGGAYRAAALMVRRTLELLCKNKEATGSNLKDRLAALSKYATLSPQLMEAADNLRLLGNDAAHVEDQTYDDVDEPHAHVAIDVAKEILKAVYQHDDLIARLKSLQKRKP
jgi:hypothetical protein